MRSCLLWISKESGFLRWSLLPSENAMKIVEITTRDLGYCITLVDKPLAGFERIVQFLKKFYRGKKCCQIALSGAEKLSVKGRVNRCGKLHYCLILRNCHNHRNFQLSPPWSVSSHQNIRTRGFSGGSMVKNPPASVRDIGSIPCMRSSHMPQSN